jgi:long-chain acyl-CoA synthetase
MLSHLNVASTLSSIGNTGFALVPTDVHLSYLPLAHVFERCIVTGIMGFGGTICFYSGDVMKIKDDLMLCKPTIFVSVPRLYHRLYSAIKDKLD